MFTFRTVFPKPSLLPQEKGVEDLLQKWVFHCEDNQFVTLRLRNKFITDFKTCTQNITANAPNIKGYHRVKNQILTRRVES